MTGKFTRKLVDRDYQEGMDGAYMLHSNEELKGLRRHFDQMAHKRGIRAQTIQAYALDYCGSFRFARVTEQAGSASTAPIPSRVTERNYNSRATRTSATMNPCVHMHTPMY